MTLKKAVKNQGRRPQQEDLSLIKKAALGPKPQTPNPKPQTPSFEILNKKKIKNLYIYIYILIYINIFIKI